MHAVHAVTCKIFVLGIKMHVLHAMHVNTTVLTKNVLLKIVSFKCMQYSKLSD